MIKFIQCGIFILFAVVNLHAQKVKFDENQIRVGKKVAYQFVQTQEANAYGMNQFTLSDMEGNPLLVIKDSILLYVQLPHEQSARIGLLKSVMFAPEINQQFVVGEISKDPRNKITRLLDNFGFFMEEEMSEETFGYLKQSFEIAEDEWKKSFQEFTLFDSLRQNNARISEARFDPFVKRDPSPKVKVNHKNEILEGKIVIGKMELSKTTEYAKSYKIYNASSKEIGFMSIILNDKRFSVKTFLDEKKVEFAVQPLKFETKLKDEIDIEDYEWSIKCQAILYLIKSGYL